ncbi:hypothetical protein P4203_27900 [Pseudomonas aeruginosa]|nr:hypothetical protein [Pseudomonas aeruginosa]
MTSDPQKNAFDLDYSSRERQFPEGFKRKIVADLQEGMPQFDVLQYFGNQPDIFETYDHLVLATDPEGERIIGILGAKDFVRGSTRFLYLWTAMVVDRYHRTSLFKRINQFFLRQVSERNGGLPPLIVAKTYNPVVYNMFRALGARIQERLCTRTWKRRARARTWSTWPATWSARCPPTCAWMRKPA